MIADRAAKRTLVGARRFVLRAAPLPDPMEVFERADVAGQAASDVIRARVDGDEPAMVARLGLVELRCLLNYLAVRDEASLLRKSARFVRGRTPPFWWDDATALAMLMNAGYFPTDPRSLAQFCERMLADLPSVDVLGSWLLGEQVLAPYLHDAVRVRLRDLEPYYHANPWTAALTGKVVLVVHPFAQSIERQYTRRTELFSDPRVLPEFELKTIQAVQSIAGNQTRFETWFDALESMSGEIANTDFEVAILGCGAYGLPLAAHVKRLGKKAVHLGGATQILFGVRGKRWEQHDYVSTLFNDHWVRPLPSERPPEYAIVEDGCYW